MRESLISSETLAHWSYTQTEWRDFVSFVLDDRSKAYRKLTYWTIGIIAAAFVVMTLLVLIPYVMLKPRESIWREDVWAPVFAVGLVSFIILAAMGISWLWFKEKDRQLKSSSKGEVMITPTAVIINGSSSFNWGFEKHSRCRFESVKRKTVATGEGKHLEILQFNCSIRLIKSSADGIERIPIPMGKETEAERIIERLSAENERFAEK